MNLSSHVFSRSYSRDDRGALLRVPFDSKKQDSRVGFVAPATPAEQQKMLRNMSLHHRDGTYSGLSDPMLLANFTRHGLFAADDHFRVGFGTTLPVGETEVDPLKAGANGEKHLHIQFGTGTFDPVLELDYRAPIGRGFYLGGFISARGPLYENSKTYRAPPEITSGVQGAYVAAPWVTLTANLTLFLQGFAKWDGVRDENSGLVGTSAVLGADFHAGQGLRFGVGVRIPISQDVLGDGDAFDQGPMILANTQYSF